MHAQGLITGARLQACSRPLLSVETALPHKHTSTVLGTEEWKTQEKIHKKRSENKERKGEAEAAEATFREKTCTVAHSGKQENGIKEQARKGGTTSAPRPLTGGTVSVLDGLF